MGGGYYDGDVEERTSSSREVCFAYRGGPEDGDPARRGAHPDLSPRSRDLECAQQTPIVVAIDVTRSRGDDVKRIYDKMPMLIGQLRLRDYLPDPAISFAAIGDATVDEAPLQVGTFAGDNRLDAILEHVWLEEGGGGTGQESYELAAYYYARHTSLGCLATGKKGYFFFVGDEGFYPNVSKEQVARVVGDSLDADLDASAVFRELGERFEVFYVYSRSRWEEHREGIDAEIRARVLAAGGRYDGVDLRASLVWNNRNDLDLHVVTPAGEHIYFGNRRASCSGELDVDRNVTGETVRPVENVRWVKGTAAEGRYLVYVQNFRFHEPDHEPTPFQVELEVGGRVSQFHGVISPDGETGELSNTTAFAVNFDPSERPRRGPGEPEVYAGYREEAVMAQWASVLAPQHLLVLEDPGAIADVVLGALALAGGRELCEYLDDMAGRGQTETRRRQTDAALQTLARARALAKVSQPLVLEIPADSQRRGPSWRP